MLTSITLRNFKSFGEEQTIPLNPITALVGPNNSGKSNLVSLGRFVRNVAAHGVQQAANQEGGWDFLLHRPSSQDALTRIGWSDGAGAYVGSIQRAWNAVKGVSERIMSAAGAALLAETSPGLLQVCSTDLPQWPVESPLWGLSTLAREGQAAAAARECYPSARSTRRTAIAAASGAAT